MGDVAVLLARDHAELDRLATILASTSPRLPAWREALEATRRGFAAHADAQAAALDRVLSQRVPDPDLARTFAHVIAGHRTQERILEQLSAAGQSDAQRTCDALDLRAALLAHDEEERLIVLPRIRSAMSPSSYLELAPSYASGRIHALGQLRELGLGGVL